jgi:hypothetical protein
MNTTGRYYLKYDPRPEYATEYIEPDIRMSIDSEANLEEMCSFFDSFLKAAGYVYDGEVKVITPLKNVIGFGENGFAAAAPSGISGVASPNPEAIAIGTCSPWGNK